MKYVSCYLFQLFFNGLICVQILELCPKIIKIMEKLMQKQVGDWQKLKFLNSRLPAHAWTVTVDDDFLSMIDGIKKKIDGFDLQERFF